MFKITKDHLEAQDGYESCAGDEIDEMPLYGMERVMGMSSDLVVTNEQIPFKLYDDDDNLCYEGLLDDDDECENQLAALRWGETMAGCTYIKVKRDGEWKVEIG